jgi:hypothetical protein
MSYREMFFFLVRQQMTHKLVAIPRTKIRKNQKLKEK